MRGSARDARNAGQQAVHVTLERVRGEHLAETETSRTCLTALGIATKPCSPLLST
jgi:hypothetical protein